MKALVVGSAACVWDDVKRAREQFGEFDAVYCVKRAGIEWPEKFKTWVTLHPEFMDDYEKRRHALNLPNGYEIVAPLTSEVGMHGKAGNVTRRVTYRYPGMTSSGSSGIYAAKVASDDGYLAVLCGIPMDKSPHFLKHEKWGTGNWDGLDSFMAGFLKSIPHMKDNVRSMSGFTRETLGAPTREWLCLT